MTVSCLEQTGKRYCNRETNSCSDSIDVCYNRRDMCPTHGIFADPSNCHRYIECPHPYDICIKHRDTVVYIYECDHGTVWNYKTGTCEDESPENVCQTYTKDTGNNFIKLKLLVH